MPETQKHGTTALSEKVPLLRALELSPTRIAKERTFWDRLYYVTSSVNELKLRYHNHILIGDLAKSFGKNFGSEYNRDYQLVPEI